MMSNGPCSSVRSFQSGCRSIVAVSTSSGDEQHEDVAEALALAGRAASAAAALLAADDVRAEVPVGPLAVALLADPLRQVEDDRDRQAVVLPGQRDQRLAGLGLDVGRVDRPSAARRPAAWRR